MVSSGTVTSDLSTLSNSFSSYQTSISELSSVWKGDSYNNLVTKSEQFISEYKSAITKQMNAFASALSSYEEYKRTKTLLAQAEAAYAQAEASQDSSSMSTYASQVSQYRTRLEQLKAEIESSLSDASTPSFAATTSSNGAVVVPLAAGSPLAAQQAISYGLELAADDTHGYSQKTRWGNPNYDCSSFVITCWDSAGTGVKAAGATYTGNMKKAFTSTGLFEWIPGNPKVEDLRPGDVLLNPNSHTEMYIGDGQMVGAHGDMDGVNGDGNGRELSVCKYHGGWEGILRYTGGSTTVSV